MIKFGNFQKDQTILNPKPQLLNEIPDAVKAEAVLLSDQFSKIKEIKDAWIYDMQIGETYKDTSHIYIGISASTNDPAKLDEIKEKILYAMPSKTDKILDIKFVDETDDESETNNIKAGKKIYSK